MKRAAAYPWPMLGLARRLTSASHMAFDGDLARRFSFRFQLQPRSDLVSCLENIPLRRYCVERTSRKLGRWEELDIGQVSYLASLSAEWLVILAFQICK